MFSFSTTVFLEVASSLSFSKAAKKLFISQPSVSRHIRLLETHYKCALFERKGNEIQLSEIGASIYAHLQDALDIQRKIEFEVSSFQNELNTEGFLKIGASTTVSLYILPGILSAFHKKLPAVQIQVVNRNAENIIAALLDKKIDVGIVEITNKINKINYDYFVSDKVIAVCVAESQLSGKKSMSIEELIRTEVALREFGSGTLSALEHELQKKNISIAELNSKIRLGGTEALKNFILADKCLGFLPQRAVKNELQCGDLVEIQGLEIKRDFYFITRVGESFELVKKFVRFTRQ